MKLSIFSRIWHRRLGIALALPLLLAGSTALLLAHGKALGLRNISVDAGWLPGYRQTSPDVELRGYLAIAGGKSLVATKNGLFQFSANSGEVQTAPVPGIPTGEIRLLTTTPGGPVAIAKGGLYRETPGGWQRLLAGDILGLSLAADGSLTAALRDSGLLESHDDGASWHPVVLPAALPLVTEPLTLARLVRDLHTGAAFLGKRGEWLWIDLLGAVLLCLGLTGFYLWAQGRLKRATKHSRPPTHPQPSHLAPSRHP